MTQPTSPVGHVQPVQVTSPVPPPPSDPPQEPVPPAQKPSRPRRWPWILIGVLMIFLFAGAGSWIGYQSAIQLRKDKQEEQKVSVAKEHFMAGLVAQSNKQYDIARKQFEYVIRLDPTFPGAQDKLREVLIDMSMKETPTPQPTIATPTLTPTVDTRPQEDIFNTAKQQFAEQKWDDLFATIDALRRVDPKFHAVEIDDMLYVALRNRGVDKILHKANLEGGLYDLALAERFGPLDVDAQGYRNWARLYLNGSVFWEVDWLKVMQAFEQIYPYFPNMTDSSGITALNRYAIAAKSYAEKLEQSGDSCGAYDYYKKSMDALRDAAVEAKANAAYLACYPPTPTVTNTPVVTSTPTQETPVVVPTATGGVNPTETQPASETTTPTGGTGGTSHLPTATPTPPGNK